MDPALAAYAYLTFIAINHQVRIQVFCHFCHTPVSLFTPPNMGSIHTVFPTKYKFFFFLKKKKNILQRNLLKTATDPESGASVVSYCKNWKDQCFPKMICASLLMTLKQSPKRAEGELVRVRLQARHSDLGSSETRSEDAGYPTFCPARDGPSSI